MGKAGIQRKWVLTLARGVVEVIGVVAEVVAKLQCEVDTAGIRIQSHVPVERLACAVGIYPESVVGLPVAIDDRLEVHVVVLTAG